MHAESVSTEKSSTSQLHAYAESISTEISASKLQVCVENNSDMKSEREI